MSSPMSADPLFINGRRISRDVPPYIIAELSANHNGKLETALKIIEEAAKAGADAVKLQTYRPDTITLDSGADEFRIKGGLWDGRTLYELYEEAHTPWEWHKPLFEHARKTGIPIFSSPFDTTAVDLLEDLLDLNLVPVIAPIGVGIGEDEGTTYNINADTAAGAVAKAMDAARLLLLTDIKGVLDKVRSWARSLLRCPPALRVLF